MASSNANIGQSQTSVGKEFIAGTDSQTGNAGSLDEVARGAGDPEINKQIWKGLDEQRRHNEKIELDKRTHQGEIERESKAGWKLITIISSIVATVIVLILTWYLHIVIPKMFEFVTHDEMKEAIENAKISCEQKVETVVTPAAIEAPLSTGE